jgi:hypothetical protein
LVLGVTYALLGVIILPFFLLFGAIAGAAAAAHGGHALPGVLGFGAVFTIMIPIFYGVMGFVGGIIGAFIYNLVAKWIGGIEVEVV